MPTVEATEVPVHVDNSGPHHIHVMTNTALSGGLEIDALKV